jgi:hypothetical protein
MNTTATMPIMAQTTGCTIFCSSHVRLILFFVGFLFRARVQSYAYFFKIGAKREERRERVREMFNAQILTFIHRLCSNVLWISGWRESMFVTPTPASPSSAAMPYFARRVSTVSYHT